MRSSYTIKIICLGLILLHLGACKKDLPVKQNINDGKTVEQLSVPAAFNWKLTREIFTFQWALMKSLYLKRSAWEQGIMSLNVVLTTWPWA